MSRVEVPWLFRGYEEAFGRFKDARILHDPEPAFRALFEALAWAVSLDSRLGGLRDPVLRGMRFARNRVHHHWADAIWLDMGWSFPMQFPWTFFEWRWRQADDLPPGPREAGIEKYKSVLQGKPVRVAVSEALNTFRTVVESRFPAQGQEEPPGNG